MPKPIATKTLVRRTVASQTSGEKYARQNMKQMSNFRKAEDPFADKLAAGNPVHPVERLEGDHRHDFDYEGAVRIIEDDLYH